MSTPQPTVVRWHRPRWIFYALVIAGVLAVMFVVADPSIMSRMAVGLVTLASSSSTALG